MVGPASAIARHLGHDRKTIRAYLFGERAEGVRVRSAADPLEPFLGYLRQRRADDRHAWSVVLFDEAIRFGFDRSYPTFTKGLRARRLRPHGEPRALNRPWSTTTFTRSSPTS